MAGDPAFSTRWLETVLADRLRAVRPEAPAAAVRLIRREGMRAIAEVEHLRGPEARKAWNVHVALPQGPPVELRTHRTWGTLRGAKSWLRAQVGPRRSRIRAAD
ncbi:MAG TPA: hypothetical protein VJQ43_01460 [Thermoplasmata archaeon]|nr:hypothetical protein [Thermoplasmata archaeon]